MERDPRHIFVPLADVRRFSRLLGTPGDSFAERGLRVGGSIPSKKATGFAAPPSDTPRQCAGSEKRRSLRPLEARSGFEPLLAVANCG